MGIGRVLLDLAMARPRPFFVRQEDAGKPARKFVCHFCERQHVSGTGWTFNLERLAIEHVITLERFDNEEINRKPNRPAPVRVAAEKITRSFARNVIDPMFIVADTKDIRLLAMD